MQTDREKVLLDSSFVLSLITSNDSNYEYALEIWDKISVQEILIPINVYIEIKIGEYFGKISKNFSLDKFLVEYDIKIIDSIDIRIISVAIESCGKGIKSMDLSVLASAIQESANLVTFDKKLGKYFNLYIKSL